MDGKNTSFNFSKHFLRQIESLQLSGTWARKAKKETNLSNVVAYKQPWLFFLPLFSFLRLYQPKKKKVKVKNKCRQNNTFFNASLKLLHWLDVKFALQQFFLIFLDLLESPNIFDKSQNECPFVRCIIASRFFFSKATPGIFFFQL